MDKFREIADYLKNYDGPPVTLMEVCGTHTMSIAKSGIKALLPENVSRGYFCTRN